MDQVVEIGSTAALISEIETMSSTTITIKILFFASAREAAGGISSANLELEADGADTKLLR
jgi:hypothetical protein